MIGPSWPTLGEDPRPERQRRLSPLFAVIGPVVVFLQFGAVAALIVATVLVLASQAVLLSPRFRDFVGRTTGRLRELAGAVVSTILLGIVYWAAIVPLSLARRLIAGSDPDHDAASGWIERGRSSHTSRLYSTERDHKLGRTHQWPGAGKSRTSKTGSEAALSRFRVRAPAVWVRALAVGVVVGLLVPTGIRLLPGGNATIRVEGSAPDSFAQPALDNQRDRDAGAQEFGEAFGRLTPTPFVGYSLPDYEGSVVNIEDRMRRSYQPAVGRDEESLDVWFFGGSVMFGFAMQRDLHTIPSEFARLAERDGIPIRVRNYGSIGYVNYQETLLLATLLEIEETPDLVVFYDGYNDKGVLISSTFELFGKPGEPTYTFFEQFASAISESTEVENLASGNLRTEPLPSPPGVQDGDAAVQNLAEVYGQGIGLSHSLADSYGFEVAHFWHPDIYSKRLDAGERGILDGVSEFRVDVWRSLSDEISAALPDEVIDVSRELDDVDGPVLSSFTHTNEAGAKHMAEVLYSNLRPRLES